MDLSQGKFVDDTQETILVKDKAINGYGSDTPHVAKLRYGASDEASTYKRQEEQTNLFLDSLKGAVKATQFGLSDKEFASNVATAGLTTATSMFYGAEMAGAAIPTFIKNVGLGYKYYADLLFKSEEERNSPEYMAQWAERQKTEEAVLGAVQEIHKRSEEVANKIGEALGAGQDSIGAFVGQTTGSVLTSLGICYLTKNPTLTAAAFALPAYENVLGTATENGKDLTASTGVALSVGTATGILERWGFQNFIEGITTKTLKGAITKASSTELIEELSQQSVEDAALIYWSKDKKFVDENGKINWGALLFDLGAAAFGGALGGALGAGGGVMLAQREMNNRRNNTIEQLTKGEKYTRGEAETIVTYLESGEDAARKKYDETYVQGVGEQKSYDDFIKNVPEITKAKEVFDEASKQASDPVQAQGVVSETLNEILDPANLPKESLDEYAKQVKDNKERIDSESIAKAEEERKKYDVRDIVESKGADERTIDATKEAVQSFAEAEAEEFGITPREAVEGKTLTVANLSDNSGLSPQEKQQILEQSGLAKEETVVAKESGVAPTQEEIDEAYAMMDAEQDKGYIPNLYMQFVGSKAASRSPQLNSLLEKAQEMASNRTDPDEIYKKTGWRLGPDWKWRYEISDSDMKFTGRLGKALKKMQDGVKSFKKFQLDKTIVADKKMAKDVEKYTDGRKEVMKVFEKSNKFKLSDIISHDILFELYPELKNTEVIFESAGLGKEMHVDEDNNIHISKNIFLYKTPFSESLLHEIQHIIQNDEGFAMGGAASNESTKVPKALQHAAKRREQLAEEFYEILEKERDVDIVRGMDKNIVPASYINNYVEDVENIAKRDNDIGLTNKIKEYKDYNEKLRDVDKESSFGKYRRLYGEIEARNTARRSNMTDMLRRMTPAEETEDIDKKDRIVLLVNNGKIEQEGSVLFQAEQEDKNIYKATNSKEEPVSNVASFNRFIEGTHATENDDVVSEANPPKKIFRGDTRYFEEYTPQENAHEYDWGTGFYLSDDYDDVVQNYQSGGADLTNRIDREAEQYAEDNDISYDEAREQLRKKYEQEDIVREFYLSMKNPVIIGGDKETFFDFEESYDEETGEYGEPTGTGVELVSAIESYLYDIGADSSVGAIKDKLFEGFVENGGLSASQLEDIIRGTEEANYLVDYNSSPGEMLSNAFKRLGFDGIIDHRAGTKFKNMNMNPDTTHYIVFDSNQAKSVDNKGEWSTSPNFYLQSEQQPRAFISFEDEANVLVGMLNSADISYLPHEMVHGFTRLHVQNCIKYNKFSSIEDVMKYFGVTDPMELITNVEIQERMARMGIKYVQESEAPTAGLRRYFEMFKRFGKKLVSSWKSKGLIDEEELPDEVRKFFDSLLGKKKKEKIDYERIAEQKADVIQAIKRIKAGEAVDVSGLPISEVRKLMKVMQTRIPKMPQNLKNALIQAGGIDINFAKNFDFVQTSGEEKNYRLFKRNGAINSEDSLIEFLETNGFIARQEMEDYNDTAEQWERVEQAIENMDNTYRESDMEKVLERESIEEGIGQATDIIRAVGAEDAFEVIEDIDKLKGRVVAEKEYLESLERKVKNLDKDYKKLYDQLLKDQAREFAQETKEQVKQAKNEIKDYRNQVIDFIKKQDLELKDKAKLISVVKRANTKASFEKVINDVKDRAATLYRKEQVRRLSDLIQKEVSTKRPALKEQKYAYEENKLFSDLRDWNKLNKSDAGIRYEAMHNDEEFMGNLTREDEIRLLFLEYKAMGADASPQLLNTLLDYIQIAKRVGMESRNEQEYNKAMSLDDTKNEMIKQVEQRKGKPTVYVKWVSNLYSSLYTIFGKDIADKYELETIQNRANIKAEQHIDKVVKEVMALYGSKSKGDFLNVIAELGKKVATITTVSKDIDTPLSKQGVTRELSTLEIMDIYNAIKNEKTRDDYYYWYGKDQIDSVLSKLTNKEMLWADMMMKSVDERYAPVNESFVKNYYTDLPKVDNYWMATSEHKETKTVFDVQGDFNQQSPSFLKERVKSRVLPKPTNAYSKYTKHIKGTFWVTEMADKQVELLNAISSLRVKNAIENKLGKDTYSALKRQVESLSFGGLMEDVDFVTGVIDKAINNVVVAKISLGIPVFTGQLSSVGLYAENMGAGEWAVEFAKGLAQPRKTYEFMKANVGDFLMNRFGGGYDETIGSVLREAEEGKGKYSLSPKTKYNVVSALTSFVRTGDIGAIIFGGYPRLKQLLETMPREEAIKQFEMETLRGQQSNVSASKSAFQQRKGMARVFTSFRNFQYQAVRKIVDSVYGYMNGEVSATQAGKTIALYALYSPIAYELFRQLGNMLFVGTDAFKDLASKLFQAIMMQELSIVPIGNDVVNYGIKKYLGQYAKSGITTVGVDDLFRAIDKSYKEKKDVYDYGEIVSPFIEMMTGFPSQRIISTTKKILENY